MCVVSLCTTVLCMWALIRAGSIGMLRFMVVRVYIMAVLVLLVIAGMLLVVSIVTSVVMLLDMVMSLSVVLV